MPIGTGGAVNDNEVNRAHGAIMRGRAKALRRETFRPKRERRAVSGTRLQI
jgi:hypothetical protein